MSVTNVLAVVPTADFATASGWYEQLLGRAADRTPMDGCHEWQLTDNGGIQLVNDATHAGSTQVTIAVPDVEVFVAEATGRGVAFAEVGDVPSGRFRLGTVADPDGNTLTFAQVLD